MGTVLFLQLFRESCRQKRTRRCRMALCQEPGLLASLNVAYSFAVIAGALSLVHFDPHY